MPEPIVSPTEPAAPTEPVAPVEPAAPDVPAAEPTSPQRRQIGDYAAKVALQRLQDKVGDGKGRFFDDSPEGPAWFSETVGPDGLHAKVVFTGNQTKMELAAKSQTGGDERVTFFTKIASGYNPDSAANFVRRSYKIFEEIHGMY